MSDQDKRTERARTGKWTLLSRRELPDHVAWDVHNGSSETQYTVTRHQQKPLGLTVAGPDGAWWSCTCPDFAGIPRRKKGNWERELRCKHIEALRLYTAGGQIDVTPPPSEPGEEGQATAAPTKQPTGGQSMSSNGNVKTLEGYTPEEAFKILATPLPPECYKPVPGGADLTDIDPIARDVVMNHVFGPCGVGWSYTYDQITVEPFTRKGGSSAFRAFIPKLELRALWTINGEKVWSEPIPVAGSSINSEVGYAAKGAATSAISGAASHLGFQQLVYQGKLTERTAKAAYAKYGPHPFEAAIVSAMLQAKALQEEGSGDNGAESGSDAKAEATSKASTTKKGDKASDKQKGYICTLLAQLGYEGHENEALIKNDLPKLEDMTSRQAGAAIARLKEAVAAKKEKAEAAVEEPKVVEEPKAEPEAKADGQASKAQVNKIFALLAELGYTGENARKALTSRGYDPDNVTADVASAVIGKLQGQVNARKAAQKKAA